jgi:hypothetical protein
MINIPTEPPKLEFQIRGGEGGTIEADLLELMKVVNEQLALHGKDYLKFLAKELEVKYNLDDMSEYGAAILADHIQELYEDQKKSPPMQ